ncbi:unnamed protein product [Dracunculus medinensis]|uniref:Aquaporin-9 n=1 Tax=Dracunculus medinensis TaxID=318479 RepID=A0A0N4UPU2_DRAME|nr:unnamed protein product [Dracunculus medinensis]
METWRETFVERIRIENTIIRECLAEFIGTFFFVFIGTSANVQFTLNDGDKTSAQIAWGIGFAFAIYLATTASGGHINPAISLTALMFGDISLLQFLLYLPVQFIGAFIGAAFAYLTHLDNIASYLRRHNDDEITIAGLFTTFPAAQMSYFGSIIDQIVGTIILSGMIYLITDRRQRISKSIQPILIGGVMSMIAMTFGANCGFAINPARDFGPRVFLLIIGYGWQLFSYRYYYFWIPVVAPLIGAPIGAILYKIFVGIHGLDEQLDITGGPPYPRNDDKEYRVSR